MEINKDPTRTFGFVLEPEVTYEVDEFRYERVIAWMRGLASSDTAVSQLRHKRRLYFYLEGPPEQPRRLVVKSSPSGWRFKTSDKILDFSSGTPEKFERKSARWEDLNGFQRCCNGRRITGIALKDKITLDISLSNDRASIIRLALDRMVPGDVAGPTGEPFFHLEFEEKEGDAKHLLERSLEMLPEELRSFREVTVSKASRSELPAPYEPTCLSQGRLSDGLHEWWQTPNSSSPKQR